MTYHRRTVDVAKGKWRGILLELGLPESCLKNKHGPCPLCDGKTSFRWDNEDGRGTFICTHCGAGDGMKLACSFLGEAFPAVASRIDTLCSNLSPDTIQLRRDLSAEDRRQALRAVFAATQQLAPGDLADKYLTMRGLGELTYPKALRFGSAVKDGLGGVRPCMVAIVTDPEDNAVSLHRTFLRPDGLAKAEMEAPRKLMPGSLPDGSAVRLSDGPSSVLGIAEGIETALSASAMYDIPVWAAINATMMAKWTPPDWCEEVAIFGDNDPKFGGQAAAYALAHKLAVRGLAVTVHIPTRVGTDWNDVRMIRKVG